MSTRQPRHPFDWLQSFVHNHRRAILLIVLLLLIVGTFVYIIANQSCSGTNKPCTWANDMIVGLNSLGILIMFLQLIISNPSVHRTPETLLELAANITSPRNILEKPLLTDSRTIEQRVDEVEKVFALLCQSDVTAVVLTGIVGIGKSTLASLIYDRVERQRLATSEAFFNVEPFWLKIDRDVTMADLVNTLFNGLEQPLPDLNRLIPENQAAVLFKALNSTRNRRLIILDQLENLLDGQTAYAFEDRSGIGQMLDAINSQPCHCRLLFTCRFWPKGTRNYPPTYMQEYIVNGLEADEGMQLLKKQGVKALEDGLHTVVQNYDGHAGALKELADMLRNDSSLQLVIEVPLTAEAAEYAQLRRRIAKRLLDAIYKIELNKAQREVLLAFSVYREPVTLEAVQFLINSRGKLTNAPVRLDVDIFLAHHLLQAWGELRYKLHPLVLDYAQGLFDENDEQANVGALQALHTEAARYYLNLSCPSRGQRFRLSHIHTLIEATWQFFQAQELQKAYDLLNSEGIFSDLMQFGEHNTILELCRQFIPLEKWKPERWQANQLNRTLKEACLGMGRQDLAMYYDSIIEQWQARRVD